MSQSGINEFRYRFTNDKKWLKKYLELRKYVYKHDHRLKKFRFFSHLEEGEYSTLSAQMLLIFHKDLCIAGACLTISIPKTRVLLPLEKELNLSREHGSFVQKTFPKLPLEQESYCEFSRLIVHPDYRQSNPNYRKSRSLTNLLMAMLCHKAKEQSVKYMFAMVNESRFLLYQDIFMKEFGMNINILSINELFNKSVYKEVEMYIMMGDLDTASLPECLHFYKG